MNVDQWAQRWNLSSQALIELRAVFTDIPAVNISDKKNKSEASVSNVVKLEASRKGLRLWRNNVGAMKTEEGNYIRFGLANESEAINRQVKSADLIGVRPVFITPDLIGRTIGQFVSREIKHPGWKYSGTEREKAQLAWAQFIAAQGGDACFATGEGTL
jgi:hypothetical protein